MKDGFVAVAEPLMPIRCQHETGRMIRFGEAVVDPVFDADQQQFLNRSRIKQFL